MKKVVYEKDGIQIEQLFAKKAEIEKYGLDQVVFKLESDYKSFVKSIKDSKILIDEDYSEDFVKLKDHEQEVGSLKESAFDYLSNVNLVEVAKDQDLANLLEVLFVHLGIKKPAKKEGLFSKLKTILS